MPFLTPAGAAESEVAFLGTGSAMPSKYRNVTGMLVRLSPTCSPGTPPPSPTPAVAAAEVVQPATPLAAAAARVLGGISDTGGRGAGALAAPTTGSAFEGGGSILLDAGEGSMGQLWRMFGDSSSGGSSGGGDGGNDKRSGSRRDTGAQEVLRNLSAVWISHPHADHHLGLVKILSERNKLLRGGGVGESAAVGGRGGGGARLPNLLLMAPAPVASWLKVRTDARGKHAPAVARQSYASCVFSSSFIRLMACMNPRLLGLNLVFCKVLVLPVCRWHTYSTPEYRALQSFE